MQNSMRSFKCQIQIRNHQIFKSNLDEKMWPKMSIIHLHDLRFFPFYLVSSRFMVARWPQTISTKILLIYFRASIHVRISNAIKPSKNRDQLISSKIQFEIADFFAFHPRLKWMKIAWYSSSMQLLKNCSIFPSFDF